MIVDFAHNEAGLVALLEFGRTLCGPSGKLIGIIGTAGDRNDASLIEIARLATLDADYVIAKNTTHYLRGRSQDELMDLYVRGIESGREVPYETSENELTAVVRALELGAPRRCHCGHGARVRCRDQRSVRLEFVQGQQSRTDRMRSVLLFHVLQI